MTTTPEELAQAMETALARAERERNTSPLQRMSAGFAESEAAFQEAVAAEERIAGRPLNRHEERAVRRRLADREGGPR